jgi:Fic family protein
VRQGLLGRKELSAVTGVSFTTITKTVMELLEIGALTEEAKAPPQRGWSVDR